jgi:hypothetical protein
MFAVLIHFRQVIDRSAYRNNPTERSWKRSRSVVLGPSFKFRHSELDEVQTRAHPVRWWCGEQKHLTAGGHFSGGAVSQRLGETPAFVIARSLLLNLL